MKKLFCIILIIFCGLQLTSCYQDLQENCLEDYITCINKNNIGYSDVEIDRPKYFLPSISFLQNYDYIEGDYFWREDDPLRGLFTTNVRPEISFLYLKYDENVYYSAKEYVIQKIPPYHNRLYEYNDYIFYENSNFVNLKGSRRFPEHFTMVCYNDKNYTLIFMGLDSGTLSGPSCLEKQYLNDIDNNWISFIDTYYGECYDFNQ